MGEVKPRERAAGLGLSVRHFVPQGHDADLGCQVLCADTNQGLVALRFWEAPGARAGVVCLGGAGGGWDTPARGLYPRLGPALAGAGISATRVKFRDPFDLEASVLDALVGVHLLATRGCERIGFIGHSFGGAVAILAATHTARVRTVVTLATQSYGAMAVSDLPVDCPVLLIHGTADKVLSPICSEAVYAVARGPRAIKLLGGAGHGLDEAAEEVEAIVRGWLGRELAAPAARGESRPVL